MFNTGYEPQRLDLLNLIRKVIDKSDKDIYFVEFDILTAIVSTTLLDQLETVRAYVDTKCAYGYMVLCDDCKRRAPYWVNTTTAIDNPPTSGTQQQCELCKMKGKLK